MVLGILSWYWEQTLAIFEDVLLEKTVHTQLGHRLSQVCIWHEFATSQKI